MEDITLEGFALFFFVSGFAMGIVLCVLGWLLYILFKTINWEQSQSGKSLHTILKEGSEMKTFTTKIQEPKFGIGWKKEDVEGGGQIITNERMGVSVEYGATMSPEGDQLWDQPRIVSPGGAVLVAFAINSDGAVLLGLDYGLRQVAQRKFPQFIRGFSDPKEIGYESPLDTATREWNEESLRSLDPSRMTLLLDGVNMDTAWFFHSMIDEDQVGGVSFYALEIPFEELAVDPSGEIAFKEGIKFPEKGKGAELAKLAFYSAVVLDLSPAKCGLTKMGVLLLMEHLRTIGTI